jgi:hypothetical protein
MGERKRRICRRKESGNLRRPGRLDCFFRVFRVFRVFRGSDSSRDWVAGEARAGSSAVKNPQSNSISRAEDIRRLGVPKRLRRCSAKKCFQREE